jgi:hypothetical protein
LTTNHNYHNENNKGILLDARYYIDFIVELIAIDVEDL